MARLKNPAESFELTRASGSEEEKEPNIRGLKVLVVDDDGDTAFILARMLIHEGAQVRWAASVSEAFDLITSFQPGIILSDLSMPEEDGYDLIRKFRSLHGLGPGVFVPAIAISSYSSPAAMQRSFEEGYQAFFPKPVKAQYLVEAIAKLVRIQKTLPLTPMSWPVPMPLKRVF